MKNFILLSIFLQSFNLNAQYIYQHNYGNNRNERCQSAYQTSDGGFLLNGVTTSFGTGDADAMIVKTDAQGNILWVQTCGTSAYEIPTFATETFDNKIVFTGSTDAFGSNDAMIFKTDSAGNLIWSKSFGGIYNEAAVKIIELPDHGYGITGTTESYGAGLADIYFVKTDANGDTLFTRIYGTNESEAGKSISTTTDGGFILCGKSSAMINGFLVIQAILMRTDSAGNLLWTKLYGDTLFQEAQWVEQTTDGGFIVCGSRDFTDHGNYDILLFKTDSAGNIQWSKTYGGNKGEGSYTVNLNEDNTYVLSGYTNSMGFGHRGDDSTNIFLMKTDQFGDTLWTRTYGDSLQEEAFLSAKTADGGYILSGFSDYHNADSSQMLVIKTDSLGFSGCYEFTSHPVIVNDLMAQYNANYSQSSGMAINSIALTSTSRVISESTLCLSTEVNELSQSSSFSIFPNPADDRLFVKNHSSTDKPSNHTIINLYNMLGDKIVIPEFLNNDVNYIELNVALLNQGMYLLEIVTDNKRAVQKLIIE